MSRGRHRCDETCVCPIHRVQMFWSPQERQHACRVVDCKYAAGYYVELRGVKWPA